MVVLGHNISSFKGGTQWCRQATCVAVLIWCLSSFFCTRAEHGSHIHTHAHQPASQPAILLYPVAGGSESAAEEAAFTGEPMNSAHVEMRASRESMPHEAFCPSRGFWETSSIHHGRRERVHPQPQMTAEARGIGQAGQTK